MWHMSIKAKICLTLNISAMSVIIIGFDSIIRGYYHDLKRQIVTFFEEWRGLALANYQDSLCYIRLSRDVKLE